MTLSPVAEEAHVDEALRLFRISTMQAVLSGHSLEGMTRPDLIRQVDKIEKVLKERVAIGSTVSVRALVNELVNNKGFPEHSVLRCIDLLVKQEKNALQKPTKISRSSQFNKDGFFKNIINHYSSGVRKKV